MRVLDIDMDYFMTEVAHRELDEEGRLEGENYANSVWSEDRVIDFLENNLGLSKANRLPGRIVCGHDEALYFWKELIKEGKLSDPFDVVHVDSHADLGLGSSSYLYIMENFGGVDIKDRRAINTYVRNGKTKHINIGDYLLWAVAFGMISSITYCANPYGDKNDYVLETLKDFREEPIKDKPVTNCIQLKYNDSMKIPKQMWDKAVIKKYCDTAIKDPEVEFQIIPTIEGVNYDGKFDYIVFAQSPNYTPKEADYIIDIIREYIIEI